MSTKSFSTNFTFNSKTSDALVKAIEVSTPVSNQSMEKVNILSVTDLREKLTKKTNAKA
ncbi:hypothetical protein [Leuconostoc citreum]|uniref:hypothetical protein n=1 Tax=Leuconostoc citreum TaxID=33964 RepID=UPI000541CCC8|nr:hypothetical protein [Leuconostoc citreum]MDV8931114.1 hypothetical protein [Leuconostoc citreum]CDX66611.1 Protein of unknown function [Leuconostoc citreum]